MAVVGVSQAKFFPIQGQSDPRLPIGRWIGEGIVVGDLSGGNAIARIILAGSTALSSPVFSVDYLSGRRNDNGVDTTAFVQLGAFSFDPEIQTFSPGWACPLIEHSTNSGLDTTKLLFPLYTGTRRVTSNDPTSIDIFYTTNTNGVTYRVQAWGHYWALDTLKLPGGPLRPETVSSVIDAVPGGQSHYSRLRAGRPR